MNTAPKTHPLDQELGDLWFGRDSLDVAGWKRLYEIVHGILISYRPPELAGLREERDLYVQEFFEDKVIRRDVAPGRVHAGALKVFYVYYLRDRLAEAAVQRKYFISSGSDAEKDFGGIDDCGSESPDDVLTADGFTQLKESGISVEDVGKSARAWLSKSEPWVAVYLAFHFCPDKEKREPLGRLARRLGVISYHHKAVKLGINWGEEKSGNLGKTFEETLIGRWGNLDLGIPFTAENREMWSAAMKILCFEALNWAEAQEAIR